MTAEQDGLSLDRVKTEHGNQPHICQSAYWASGEPCLPYRLAVLAEQWEAEFIEARNDSRDASARARKWRARAERTEAKVARVNFLADEWRSADLVRVSQIDGALADSTPVARCPQETPLEALSEPTCNRPEGHEGSHVFTSHDGKTPLEMMPK